MQKPAVNPKQAEMTAKRKALIAAKAQPVATVQPTEDPSLFSLGQEAKAFAARVDSGFKSSVGKLASVTPSIEATEPRQKAVVGSPGAQGLPGQQGINGTGLPWVSLTEAEYEALAVKDPNTIYDNRTERTFDGFDACFTVNPVTRTIHAEMPPLPRPILIYGVDDFAAAAADTPEQHAERVLQIVGTDPCAYLQALIDGTELPTPPKRVPREIPNWRANAMLAKLGLLETVEQAISSIPEPQRTVVMLAWNGDAKLARNGPTVLSLAGTLGLTPEQLDAIFIEADLLNI
ncbi:MAG: hypothetical protein E6R03_06925 [Hyphomicrobiaceae bacterium]|nr:MAG: hypothetical protein E6R03_06925 [Hyphomicrobiaceae bacterium]